jgi:hypothetical protein
VEADRAVLQQCKVRLEILLDDDARRSATKPNR